MEAFIFGHPVVRFYFIIHRAALVGMCYNANFNQEMLKDFVEGKLHSITFGEPLQHRLNTLEK